jgi:hypothetical protein
MIRTRYRPRQATNYCGDVCLCAWHPCVKDTISFRWIVSQYCYFMIVGMMYCCGLNTELEVAIATQL